jgi:hypothetical protein
MAIMQKGESEFGAPAGIYSDCRFEGVFPMSGPPRNGRDGKPLPPGIEWRFKIMTGAFAGRTIGRITGTKPTTKNSCGVMLDGLAGRPLGIGENFDPDTMIGQVYQVVVDKSKENPDKTHVTSVFRNGVARPSGPTGAATGFSQPDANNPAL